MPERTTVKFRLRTRPSSSFSQHFVHDGEWVGEAHDSLLAAAQEFIDRRGRGSLRVMRDVRGHPQALFTRELRVVNDYIEADVARRIAGQVSEAKRRKAAA